MGTKKPVQILIGHRGHRGHREGILLGALCALCGQSQVSLGVATDSRPAPSRLFAPVDGASLIAFRIAFGAILVVLVARYFLHGWIEEQYYRPSQFFPWPGLSWIRPWPRPWMEVHFAVLGALALLITAGRFTRASLALFCLGFTYVHLIDRTNYLNHYYLISLLSFLMAFMPLGAGRARTVPAWMPGILRFQVGIVYFCAGLAKLHEDWLVRAQPLRTWLAEWSHVPLVGPLLAEPWVAHLSSWAAAGFDLSFPFLMCWKRTRRAAFAVGLLFHGITALLFPIGLFPWIMMAAALVFFPPDWPRRFFPSPRPDPLAEGRPGRPRVLGAFLAVYVLLQVVVPFRYLFHEGNVLWSEQGFRFSWRVMVIEKVAYARFTAVDPTTGLERQIDPESFLTEAQVHFMKTQPDMILDFARAAGDRLSSEGRGRPHIRAEVWVSLNGRPSERMIDPTVDLADRRLSSPPILPLRR